MRTKEQQGDWGSTKGKGCRELEARRRRQQHRRQTEEVEATAQKVRERTKAATEEAKEGANAIQKADGGGGTKGEATAQKVRAGGD